MSLTTKFIPHSLIGIVSVLPALLVMPAMASAPNTDGNAFVFGDIVAPGGQPIEYMAFGGRRMAFNESGKYQNDFPQYNMLGRSLQVLAGDTPSTLYVGPVT